MLAPQRHEKGKPAARRVREHEGPVKEQVAGLPNGGGVAHATPGIPFLPAEKGE